MDSREITDHFKGLTEFADRLTGAFAKSDGIEARTEYVFGLDTFFAIYPMASTTVSLIVILVIANFFLNVFFPERRV